MRCDKCNAKLDAFGEAVKDLDKCPLCGSEMEIGFSKQPDSDDKPPIAEDDLIPLDNEIDQRENISQHRKKTTERHDKNDSHNGSKQPHTESGSPSSAAAGKYDEPEFDFDTLILDESKIPEVNNAEKKGSEKPESVSTDSHRPVSENERKAEPSVDSVDGGPLTSRSASVDNINAGSPGFASIIFGVWLLFFGITGLSSTFLSVIAELISEKQLGAWEHALMLCSGSLLLSALGIFIIRGRNIRKVSCSLLGAVTGITAFCVFLDVLFTQNEKFATAHFGWAIGVIMVVLVVSFLTIKSVGLASRILAAAVAFLAGFTFALHRQYILLQVRSFSVSSWELWHEISIFELAVPGVIALGALVTILYVVRVSLDAEKSFTESVFSYAGPALIILAIAYFIVVNFVGDIDGKLKIINQLALISVLLGLIPLVAVSVLFSWWTEAGLKVDMQRFDLTFWVWHIAAGVWLLFVWLLSGTAGIHYGALIVAFCVLILLMTGLSSLKLGAKNDWLHGSLGLAMLFLGIFLAHYSFGLSLPVAGIDNPSFFILSLPYYLLWYLAPLTLIFAGLCTLYSNSDAQSSGNCLCKSDSAITFPAIAAFLSLIAVSTAYISGVSELQESIIHQLLLLPFFSSVEGVELPFLIEFLSPVIIIFVSLSLSLVFWGAAKRYLPARILSGAAALVIAIFFVLVLTKMFPSWEVHYEGLPYDLSMLSLTNELATGLYFLLFYTLLILYCLRFLFSLPAFFRKEDSCGVEVREHRNYDKMLNFGMLVGIFMLWFLGNLAYDWGLGDLVFQIRGHLYSLSNSIPQLGAEADISWYGYKTASLALIVFLFAMHRESKAGKKDALPFLAAFWAFLIAGLWWGFLTYLSSLSLTDLMPGQFELVAFVFIFIVLLSLKLIRVCILCLFGAKVEQNRDQKIADPSVLAFSRIGIALSYLALIAFFVGILGRVFDMDINASLHIMAEHFSSIVETTRVRITNVTGGEFLLRVLWFLNLLILIVFYLSSYERKYFGRLSALLLTLFIFSALVVLGGIFGMVRHSPLSIPGAWFLSGFVILILSAMGITASGWGALLKDKLRSESGNNA